MARSKIIYTLKEIADMIGENLELLEEVTSNSDNIAEGEMVHVRDGSEYGTRGLTGDGVEGLQELLADIRMGRGDPPVSHRRAMRSRNDRAHHGRRGKAQPLNTYASSEKCARRTLTLLWSNALCQTK